MGLLALRTTRPRSAEPTRAPASTRFGEADMTVRAAHAVRLFSCLTLAALCSSESVADPTEIACSLNYQAKGWSAVVEGRVAVACSDGSSRPVSIRMRSIGATAGKSRVDHGAGRFTHVHSIED